MVGKKVVNYTSYTMLLAAVFAFCVASHAIASAATVPLPEKIYYDLKDAENLFKEHEKIYMRNYNRKEQNKRLDIFKMNLKHINELNAEFPRTVFGVTHFADLTPEEIKMYHGGRPFNNTIEIKENSLSLNVEMKPAPDSFDWREHGAVTPVRDQGECGSCYIFSAIGSIEGQYAIKHKQCIAFSAQQCLDCLGYYGCEGGFADQVIGKLAKRVGCMTEKAYPYYGFDNQRCQEKADEVVAKVTGGGLMNITDAEDLKEKLYNIGPLSIGLDSRDFLHYKGGILHPKKCSSHPLLADHAVLLVGYGEEHGEKYWIIKNSWGNDFGEKGFVRLLRGVNACGAEADRISTAQVA